MLHPGSKRRLKGDGREDQNTQDVMSQGFYSSSQGVLFSQGDLLLQGVPSLQWLHFRGARISIPSVNALIKFHQMDTEHLITNFENRFHADFIRIRTVAKNDALSR